MTAARQKRLKMRDQIREAASGLYERHRLGVLRHTAEPSPTPVQPV